MEQNVTDRTWTKSIRRPAHDAAVTAVVEPRHSARAGGEPASSGVDAFAALRAREYSRLDRTGEVYLDYTGASLYAESQVREHLALLRHRVLGNPHSENPTSRAATQLADRARAAVLSFVRASPDEYTVVFTANASGASKLVGEAFPFTDRSRLVLTADNHNSVNGIREFARARGAAVAYVPLRAERPPPRPAGCRRRPRRRPGRSATPVRVPRPVELFRRPPPARVDRGGPAAWL